MNQKGFINIIVIIGVIILVGVAGYFVVSKQAPLPVPVPSPAPTPTPETPMSGPITVNGEITCLPKKGTGQQTLECAIGLKGSDGQHYGLKDLSKHDPEYKFSVGGLRVEVTGAFSQEEVSGPDGNKYDVVGIIDVTSIKEIAANRLSIEDVKVRYESSLMNTPGVVGVGIGECGSKPCIKVFLEKETPESKNIPKQLEGFKVDAEVTGPFRAL